jgi:hypothetical protein
VGSQVRSPISVRTCGSIIAQLRQLQSAAAQHAPFAAPYAPSAKAHARHGSNVKSSRNRMFLQRLKDKLGNHANASAR